MKLYRLDVNRGPGRPKRYCERQVVGGVFVHLDKVPGRMGSPVDADGMMEVPHFFGSGPWCFQAPTWGVQSSNDSGLRHEPVWLDVCDRCAADELRAGTGVLINRDDALQFPELVEALVEADEHLAGVLSNMLAAHERRGTLPPIATYFLELGTVEGAS